MPNVVVLFPNALWHTWKSRVAVDYRIFERSLFTLIRQHQENMVMDDSNIVKFLSDNAITGAISGRSIGFSV